MWSPGVTPVSAKSCSREPKPAFAKCNLVDILYLENGAKYSASLSDLYLKINLETRHVHQVSCKTKKSHCWDSQESKSRETSTDLYLEGLGHHITLSAGINLMWSLPGWDQPSWERWCAIAQQKHWARLAQWAARWANGPGQRAYGSASALIGRVVWKPLTKLMCRWVWSERKDSVLGWPETQDTCCASYTGVLEKVQEWCKRKTKI